ncbi:hypothetical protein M9Y10_025431 [Tritrichomonas musculus]|uniref:Uncharacterized protein n=1 Tax=Tritrichomonas musculus TaxID=1915356 RepID=A0ABR2H8L8_9EUKA
MNLFLFLFPAILIAVDTKYKVGDRIQVTADVSFGQRYVNFYPKVDKLSMLRVPLNLSSNSNINIQNGKIKFYSNGLETPVYQLTSTVNGKAIAVEFLSLILFFEKGNLTALNWDNSFDTNSCKIRSNIIQKTCAVEYDQNNYRYIKVFTAFVGTDKDNTPFTSAQSLPSTFVKFGVGGVIDDATDFVNKAGDWFKDKF